MRRSVATGMSAPAMVPEKWCRKNGAGKNGAGKSGRQDRRRVPRFFCAALGPLARIAIATDLASLKNTLL
jgi:hypothetical protein